MRKSKMRKRMKYSNLNLGILKREVERQVDLLNSGKLRLKNTIIFNSWLEPILYVEDGVVLAHWDKLPIVMLIINKNHRDGIRSDRKIDIEDRRLERVNKKIRKVMREYDDYYDNLKYVD